VNQSTAASIITAHQNLGLLDNNGTFTGNLLISGDSDFRTLAPLLDHIVTVTGTVTIQSITQFDSLNPTGSSIFTNLRTIGGNLVINSNGGFTSLGANAFSALVSIGGFVQISNNGLLASLSKTVPISLLVARCAGWDYLILWPLQQARASRYRLSKLVVSSSHLTT
jgi:hypothetical protein